MSTVNPLLSPPGGLFFPSTFEGEGGLNREWGLINFPPLKRGGLLERGGLNRGFTVTHLCRFFHKLSLSVLK